MVEKLIAAAMDLPVVFQGALGSALFALFLFLGQRLAVIVSKRYAKSSRARRKVYLIEEQIKYNVLRSKHYSTRGAFVSLLLYRATRSLFKALIWLTLGLVFGSVHEALGLAGFFGCLYYLFKGLNTVTPPKSAPDLEAKLAEIKAELESQNEA